MAAPKGYKAPQKGIIKRLILSVEGQEKEGKTSFALSAPDPIAIINMDIGLEGVIEKFGEKKIYVSDFDYRDATDQKQWEAMWVKMKRAYMDALEDKSVRTIICDTGTEMWELCRLARLGKLTQVMPHHYGPPNAEMRDMIRRAYKHDKNVIWVHKMKDEYVKEVRTGKLERQGFKDIPYLVQATMLAFRDKDGDFGIKVLNCRHNADMRGEVYMDPVNTFPEIATEMVEGSKEKDWS